MECEWKFIEDELPSSTGSYLVLWSEPYADKMSYGFEYYHKEAGRFLHSTAGANEILFWLDGAEEVPDLPREGLRTRRVKR